MKKSLLHKAWLAFGRAQKSYAAFVNAEANFDEAVEHWEDFLSHSQRCCTKIEKALPKGHHVTSYMKKQRKADATLEYLFQARHANEHSLADLGRQSPGFVQINSGKEVSSLTTLSPTDGTIVPSAGKHEKIVAQPPGLELIDVTNRGVTYPAPHRIENGVSIREHPQSAGMKLIAFLHTSLLRAEG